ncbi:MULTISPECIES: hypothetical protein [Listeria]|uniref:hypothetical protein n=1 Tax=Listeria TaxID=1637 RepID=UPI000B5947E2|nr:MULTISPECIES: hypothetical protein [Listeria]
MQKDVLTKQDKTLLERLEKRNYDTQRQVASLVHTNYLTLKETDSMSDASVEEAFNQMRSELLS